MYVCILENKRNTHWELCVCDRNVSLQSNPDAIKIHKQYTQKYLPLHNSVNKIKIYVRHKNCYVLSSRTFAHSNRHALN